MKILIDIRLLTRGGGGVGEYASHIVDHLIRAPQHDWHLFYNGWNKQPLPTAWQDTPNVTIHDWRVPNKLFRWSPMAIDRLIKTDLIFSPHLDFLRVQKTPRIMTIHDLSFIHYPHFFSRRQRLWHWLQRVRAQARQATHIVTDSVYSKNNIMETLGVAEEKVSVVHPGLSAIPDEIAASPADSGLLPPSLKLWRASTITKNKIATLQPYLLYLGTLEPRKNITAIIKAFNILKADNTFSSLKLILAGRAGWLYQSIYREAARSPHRADIVFWGPATAAEKVLLYTKARAFVYPSFFEGFGFPPLEAQQYGCPAIVANRASLPEVVGDSALQINPWRTDQLAEAMRRILTDETLRARLISAGYKNTNRFTWNQCADHLLSIFLAYS